MNYNKLKNDLENSKLSMREICRRIDISYVGLHRSLQEKTIRLNTFEKICNEVKLNPNDYFELEHINPTVEKTTLEKVSELEKLLTEIKSDLQKKP